MVDARLLRCPICHTAPLVQETPDVLVCGTEGCPLWRVYAGVPSFIDAPADHGFEQRWESYPHVQATTAGLFEQKTGWSGPELDGKLVLDAGCGCGRFSAVAGAMGAEVIGVDGSQAALRAARRNAPSQHYVHGDLLHLPLRSQSVDHAFSIGVLHHTGHPATAFAEVARTVKRGGSLAVWLYAKPVTDDRLLLPMEMLHEITRSVPPNKLRAIFHAWAPYLRNLYSKKWGPLEQVLRVSQSADDEECVSDTFDWHVPQYRSWHTEDEVRGWFRACGFEVEWVGAFPVSMRGRRL